MEQTVKTTLLEEFEKAKNDKYDVYALERRLSRHLNKEFKVSLEMLQWHEEMTEEDTAVLSELRENFDFDIAYGVEIYWDSYVDEITTEIDCDSNEVFMDYLVNERPVLEPVDTSEAEIYVECERRRVPNCRIKNLRLKDDDGVWASKIAKAIAATGIDPERVPALMHRVYSEQWQLAGAPAWNDIQDKQ